MKKKAIWIGAAAALVVIAAVLVFVLVIKPNTDNNNGNGAQGNSSESKGPKVLEIMERVSLGMSREEVDKIVGFEGEVTFESKTDSNYKNYTYKFDDESSLEINVSIPYGQSDVVVRKITADIPRKSISNSKVDLSRANEMKGMINSADGLSYEKVVEMVGGVEGTVDEISESGKQYLWQDANGGYLHASFNNKGKCTFFSSLAY